MAYLLPKITTCLAALFILRYHLIDAFEISSAPGKRKASSLSLVPGQGNQLVAACNAANLHSDDHRSAACSDNEADGNPSNARSFVSKVFSLPSAIISHKRPPCDEALFSFTHFFHKKEDIVWYPLVGFCFVKNDNGDCIPLPTASIGACPIRPRYVDQDVFGWFGPACKLDLYASDVCHDPGEKA